MLCVRVRVLVCPCNSLRSIKLLVDCENIQRLFIDEFFPHMEFIGPAMLLLYESLTVLDNCENLRSKYVLNPTSEGEAMSLPARMMVCTCALQLRGLLY